MIFSLSELKARVAALPDNIEGSEELARELDEIDALIFHIQMPLRLDNARKWFESHGAPSVSPNDTSPELSTTLTELGLD